MKKVSEVAELLKISKQAVHKRLKNPKYQPYIIKKGTTIYIQDTLFAMLKSETDNHQYQPVDERVEDLVDAKVVEMYERLLTAKNESIDRLSKEVDDMKRLLENQQVLTLNAQQEIKLLKGERDSTENQESKSFWRSLFK